MAGCSILGAGAPVVGGPQSDPVGVTVGAPVGVPVQLSNGVMSQPCMPELPLLC